MSNRAKGIAGVLALAVVVALFIALQGDNSEEPAAGGDTTAQAGKSSPAGKQKEKPKPAAVPVVRIRAGEPVGGVQDIEVTSGERARFRVISDTDGEVHVHGYDEEKGVAAGGSVSFDFPADLEGGFEVELHHGGGESQIAELKVQPG
jgi:hypothetical protein